jgi:RND family efflux transporter MFP subunit
MHMERVRLLARRAFVAGLVAFAAVAMGACSKKSGGDSDEEGAKAALPAAVTTTTVTRADVSRTLLINGPVAAVPNRDVKVSSLVSGRVAELKVAEGDRVTAGQLIAKIDDHAMRDQVTQAEAAVQQASSNLENAKQNFTRNQDLFQRGIAARKEVEDARNEQNQTEAALKTANAQLSTAQLQLTRTDIRTPINGTVVKRSVSGGEQVDGTPATPIVEVAELSEVELAANVPAASMALLKQGQTVPLKTDALPGRNFTGRIAAISQSVDPNSNAGLVRIRVSNGEGALRLGMFLGAQIPIETHKNVLTVPVQSIYRDEEGKARVFQVQGDTAIEHEVTLGIETATRDEITDGVDEGQTIILSGGYGLEDKAKITVQPATQEKDDSRDDKGKDKDDEKDSSKGAKDKRGASPAPKKDAKPGAASGAKKDSHTP